VGRGLWVDDVVVLSENKRPGWDSRKEWYGVPPGCSLKLSQYRIRESNFKMHPRWFLSPKEGTSVSCSFGGEGCHWILGFFSSLLVDGGGSTLNVYWWSELKRYCGHMPISHCLRMNTVWNIRMITGQYKVTGQSPEIDLKEKFEYSFCGSQWINHAFCCKNSCSAYSNAQK
jgi:hypothetical protein